MQARARARPIVINDISGGESFVHPYTNMPPKHSLLMQNCHISDRGGIRQIPGYAKVHESSCAAKLTSGFEFRKSNGNAQILCAGEGKIFKLDSGSLTEIKSGLNDTAKVEFSQINDTVIMCNGVDDPLKYDGTTVASLGGSPPATAFKAHLHKNRIWMIERADKMLATHSALNNGEDYTGEGSGYIDFKYVLKQGDELIDIVSYLDLLVFFFRNNIAIYSGSTPSGINSDFSLVQLISGVGMCKPGTLANWGSNMGFLYDSGIKTLKQAFNAGSLNAEDLSKNIDPVLTGFIDSAMAGGNFAAAHYPKYGWLLFLVGNTVFVYSYIWKAWGRIVGADINGMFTTASGSLYLCGTNYLYRYDSGWSFGGTDPVMRWDTAWLRLSGSGYYIYPKLIEFVIYPGVSADLTMQVQYDLRETDTKNASTFSIEPDVTTFDSIEDFDSADPVDMQSFSEMRFPIFGRGRIMKLILEKSSPGGPIEIGGINIPKAIIGGN